MDDAERQIREVIGKSFDGVSSFANEAAFQAAFAHHLGSCERELRAQFDPPMCPSRRPPQSAIDTLSLKATPRILSPEGRDPCAGRAKLDVLWKAECGNIPIELKYSPGVRIVVV